MAADSNRQAKLCNRIALICLLFISSSALGQVLTVTRADAAYNPNHKFDPAGLMALEHFNGTASGQYVIVEGYIDYAAKAWPEKDGDYHFEMQSTKKKHEHNPIDGLVCEIDPTLRLKGSEALRQINADDPQTYRKARVYGWLRFGTEANHAGVQKYKLNGKIISGHWEIHPVERVERIGVNSGFKIGPSADYVAPVIKKRYTLNDTNFQKQPASNYAALRGTVKRIMPSPDQSGDFEVALEVNSTTYTATIPQYYVQSFDSNTQTITFQHVPGFAPIHYSLKPSDSTQRTFYGLRNWQFDTGKRIPALQPVEMIK